MLYSPLISSDHSQSTVGQLWCHGRHRKEGIMDTVVIGGRKFQLVSHLHYGEASIPFDVMLGRAQIFHAEATEKDGQHLLKNQTDIPAEWGKRHIVCSRWCNDNYTEINTLTWDETSGWYVLPFSPEKDSEFSGELFILLKPLLA